MTINIKKKEWAAVAIAGLLLGLNAFVSGDAMAQTPTPAPAETAAPVETATPAATPAPVETATPAATPAPVETATPAATPAPGEAPISGVAAEPGSGGTTSIGGYGELHYTNVNGRGEGAEIDFHRFVLYLGHRFDERLSFASELEVEHGGEEVELEQAYLQYTWNRYLGIRGGLLLVPVGILNVYHEPPTFHGVERNTVDTILVPTTWREGGAAIFGEPLEGLRYQVAFFNGLNAGGFSGSSGIRGGRSEASESASNDGAVAVRLEYSPLLGLEVGGSYFEGGAGRQEIDEKVSIRLVEGDVRFQRMGIGLRAQIVKTWIDGAGALNDLLTTGAEPVAPIGSSLEGWYAEAAYDVLSFPREMLPVLGNLELIPFARYEQTNTQLDMPGAYLINPAFDRSLATAGVTFKPSPKVALKADYQWTWAASGDPDNVWHLGLGFMF